MNEYKVIYKEGLIGKAVLYVHAESQREAWHEALQGARLPLIWYKSISVKKIEPLTQARYDDMKETAIWGWSILASVVIAIMFALW